MLTWSLVWGCVMRHLFPSILSLLSVGHIKPTKPVFAVHHRIEEGMNNHAGKWAVVRIERHLADNGDVIRQRRTLVAWRESQSLAQRECDRLETKLGAPAIAKWGNAAASAGSR